MVAVVAAARDGRCRSRVGLGLHPRCGPCPLLGVEQWVGDQWRCARALACAQPKGCTRSIHVTDPPSRRRAAARTTGDFRECLPLCIAKDASGLAYEMAPRSRDSLQLDRRKLGREPEVDPSDRFVPLFRIERMLFQDLHIPKMAL